MGKEGNAIFIDLDRGIIGSFEGFDHHAGDPGLVYPKYVPFNKLKTVRYKQPVRELDALQKQNKYADLPGAAQELMIINEGKPDGLMHHIAQKYRKRIHELERQVDDLKLELATTRQRAESAQSGAKKLISEAQEVNRSGSRSRDPFNRIGGFMPPGDDYGY